MAMGALGGAICRVHDAAFDDDAWGAVLDTISGELFSSPAGLDHNTTVDGADCFFTAREIDPSLCDLSLHEINTPENNPGIAAMMRAKPGRPFPLESFVSPRVFENDPSIRLFFHPQNFDKGLFVAIHRSELGMAFISLFRERGQQDFDAEDSAKLEALAPHVSRALETRDLMKRIERRDTIQQTLLERSVPLRGYVIIDRKLRIVEADAPAREILARADGLCERFGRIATDLKLAGQDNESLRRYVDALDPTAAPFVLRCANGDVQRVRVLPIPADMRAAGGAVAIIVDVICLKRPVDLAAFAQAFDLTYAEQRLVEALSTARTATEAARAVGVTRNTVKSQLSKIYEKTSAESQTQLMLLLGRFA